jgi:hypothetical protein
MWPLVIREIRKDCRILRLRNDFALGEMITAFRMTIALKVIATI